MLGVKTGYIGQNALPSGLRIAWLNFLYDIAPRSNVRTSDVRRCSECSNYGCVKDGETLRKCGECTHVNIHNERTTESGPTPACVTTVEMPVTNVSGGNSEVANSEAATTMQAMMEVDRLVEEYLQGS